MGLIGGGSCGLGLFIGCVRRFSSGAILCSAMCKKVLAILCSAVSVTRRFSAGAGGLQEGGDKKVPNGRSHHLAPCSTLLCKQIHKYTNTQIHKYTNTQIHKYTNTQIHKYRVGIFGFNEWLS